MAGLSVRGLDGLYGPDAATVNGDLHSLDLTV
jgi:hypothetical protein